MRPNVDVPYTYWPTCEMTVGVPDEYGVACRWDARNETPRNMTASAAPMKTSVCCAFFQAGFLNAGTPLEIASTPVTAAHPDANACSMTYAPAPKNTAPSIFLPNGIIPGLCGTVPKWCVASWYAPHPMSPTM